MLEQVILWGQIPAYAGYGVILFLFLKGVIVSRSQLDQVQKTADTFRQAWEASHSVTQQQADLLSSLTVTQKTMLKVMNALPKPQTDEEPIE